MADCGATGSTLDRVLQSAVASNESSAYSKDVIQHLSNMAMGNGGTTVATAAMPPSSMDMIEMPSAPNNVVGYQPQPKQPQAVPNQVQHHPSPIMMQHPSLSMHHHPTQQQQQQQFMHQQQMMMQQQQFMLAQQMNQLKQLKLQNETKVQATVVEQRVEPESSLENWHDGLEQHVQEELIEGGDDVVTVGEEEQEETYGHEGMVQGATIEELAKAWAEAEAEYEREQQDGIVEDATNVWSGGQQDYEHHYAATTTTLPHYEFSEASREHLQDNNKSRDWLHEGMTHFEAGYTQKAIQCFETELRHVDQDNATAWLMLGKCHAENDQDRKAIACLEQACERDPYCSEALLALGVSYVNELQLDRALLKLKEWITHHPNLVDVTLDSTNTTNTTDAEEQEPLQQVEHWLLEALDKMNHLQDKASVLEALGVVYNVSKHYDKAVRVFRQAIELDPNNYQLHNKLGATLANSNQSSKALQSYRDALAMKPRYARAWLNLGISQSNLRNFEDAARCYLQTLSLNANATHVWSYLRIALSCQEEWDLIPHAAEHNLEAFRDHYDFV